MLALSLWLLVHQLPGDPLRLDRGVRLKQPKERWAVHRMTHLALLPVPGSAARHRRMKVTRSRPAKAEKSLSATR